MEMINGTRAVLDMLAGKWSVEILYLLATGTRRYSEVLYEVGEISKKTLTQTLRALERDGLVARRVIPDLSVRVEYSLTPLGWSLTEPLMALYEWAARHLSAADRLAACIDRSSPTPDPRGFLTHGPQHRLLTILATACAALTFGAAPALAGSSGCAGADCQD